MTLFGGIIQPEAPKISRGEKVWVFGTGSFGRSVARACQAHGVDVQGFVQTEPKARHVGRLPVCSWTELDSACASMKVLIGIFNREMPLDALLRLAEAAGFKNLVLPWDFYGQFAAELGWRYWLADPSYLRNHLVDLDRISERLADDTSRQCLERTVRFRIGLDQVYAGFTHPEMQYFNPITVRDFGRGLRYLDGGAYDGRTYMALTTVAPISQAWLLEPDPKNYSLLTENIQRNNYSQHPCSYLPLGLSDGHMLTRFSGDAGEAGHIDETGKNTIATVAGDALLLGACIDIIKLDVEGGETKALLGLRETIRKHRPVLAISCYHKAGDLWMLPDLLDEIAPGYELYLRQHAFNSFDLVLYAVPN
jgi:FkbM family methyltransferase